MTQPFSWNMPLCRDREELVVMEAVKALFGSLPSASGPLFSTAAAPEDSRRDVRTKARAWKLVSHEAKQALPAIRGTQVGACLPFQLCLCCT